MFDFIDYIDLYEGIEGADWSKEYQNAKPFPHTVVDGIISNEKLEQVLDSFPDPTKPYWWKYNNVFEKKLAYNEIEMLPEITQKLLCEFNSSTFIKFLEDLTGIKNLIPDPHYRGGGLHQIVNGGLLKLHADFNWNADLKLHRRVNVLLYLNKNWKPEYGGQLELWDKDVTQCYHSIDPDFNKMVIFNTTDGAIHGHPTPLNVPDGVTRKSLALYYYTAERPQEEITDPHSTIYKFKPEDNPSDELKELQKKRSKGRI